MERTEVYKVIDTEREYQRKIWSDSGVNKDAVLSIGEEILLIEEYVSRARKAWAENRFPEKEALEVVRKIAGIAVHCMEDHGGIPRNLDDLPSRRS